MITRCTNCNKLLQIPDKLAGKQGRCPACKEIFTIPSQPVEPAIRPEKTPSSTSPLIKTECPKCKSIIKAPVRFIGKKVICSMCKHPFLFTGKSGMILENQKTKNKTVDVEKELLPVFPEAPKFERGENTSREPILIPVSHSASPNDLRPSPDKPGNIEVPVLIPVSLNKSKIPISASDQVQQEAEKSIKSDKYFNSTFIMSLIIGIIVFLLLCGSAILPWIQTHQTLGSSSTNIFDKILSKSEYVKSMLNELTFEGHTTLILPLSVLLVSVIAVFLPGRRLRGIIFLIAGLISATVWLWIIHDIKNVILLWRPLVRYIQSPSALNIPNPVIGFGAWIMAAAILLLVIITAVNLIRSSSGVFITLGPFIIVAILGFLYLNDWYISSDAKVELKVIDTKTNQESIKSNSSLSESTIVLAAVNNSNKPLVIIPAYYSKVGSKPVSSLIIPESGSSLLYNNNSGAGGTKIYKNNELPGSWSRDIGEPDLILGLKMNDVYSENSLPGSKQLSVTCLFNEKQSAGVVLQPNEKCKISLTFSPVWQNKVWGVTAAGKWQALMLNANQATFSSISIDVPGIIHPQDKNLADVYKYHDNAISQFKAAFDVLQTNSNNEPFLPKSVFLTALNNFNDGREKLRNCITCIKELNKLGVKLDNTNLKSSSDQPVKSLDELSLAALSGAFEDLSKNRIQSAKTKLNNINSKDAEIVQVVQSAVKSIDRLSLETAHLDYSDKKYGDTIRLLTDIDESALIEPQVRSETANILLEAVYHYLTETGICLIHPNGSTSSIFKTQDNQIIPFSAALKRLAEWKPDLCEGDIFCYSNLVAAQQSKELTPAKAIEFIKSHADSELCQEVYCWLGVEALRNNEYQAAAEYLGKASTTHQNMKEDYSNLVGIGIALTQKTYYRDDCLKQIAVENDISGYFNKRSDWSKEIVDMVPKTVTQSKTDTAWIDRISIIENPEQLKQWVYGDHQTIAFIRMDRNKVDEDTTEKIKNAVEAGAILWTSSSLIREFGLTTQEPPSAFLHSEAKSFPKWQDIIPGNLRFSGGIEYDIRDFKLMLTAEALGNESDRYGILLVEIATTSESARNRGSRGRAPVIKPWFVCGARVIGKGLVVFLPSRIIDNKDGRLFMESLVKHRPPNR